MDEPPSAGLVDLADLRAAAGPVVAWYERFLAGEPMPAVGLETALRGLRALPQVSGRMGRALALVATGGRQATTEEAVEALEFLRCSAGLRHVPPAPSPGQDRPASSTPRRRRRRGGGPAWTQPPLPGIDSP